MERGGRHFRGNERLSVEGRLGSSAHKAVVCADTPLIFAVVLDLNFLLLLAFRWLVAPLKAIVTNLRSVGATDGLLVLVFQTGYGDNPLGFQRTPTIEAWPGGSLGTCWNWETFSCQPCNGLGKKHYIDLCNCT